MLEVRHLAKYYGALVAIQDVSFEVHPGEVLGLLGPSTLSITLLFLVPLLGWHAAGWYSLVASSLVVLLVDVLALTIDSVPFIRAYQPGHAKLKTRWPLYALGLYAFAYWPARLMRGMLDNPRSILWMVGCIAAAIALLEFAGRRTAGRWSVQSDEEAIDDRWDETLLNIGRVTRADR